MPRRFRSDFPIGCEISTGYRTWQCHASRLRELTSCISKHSSSFPQRQRSTAIRIALNLRGG